MGSSADSVARATRARKMPRRGECPIGDKVRQLRKESPTLINAEIARLVGTDPRYVGVLIGASPVELRLCGNCGKPIKVDNRLYNYRAGLCSDCRLEGHKLRRSPLVKLVCKTCKKIFPRKLCYVVEVRKRGYTANYCSTGCRDIGRRGKRVIRYFKTWKAALRYSDRVDKQRNLVSAGTSRTGKSYTVEVKPRS